MSLRTRVLLLIDVLIRVPPLFVIDEILKLGLGLAELTEHDLDDFSQSLERIENGQQYNYSTSAQYDPTIYRVFVVSMLRVLVSTLGCLAALCLFVLGTKNLMIVYLYLMSAGVVFLSYWSNLDMVRAVIQSGYKEETTVASSSILGDFLLLNFEKLLSTHTYLVPVLENALFQIALTYAFVSIHLGPRYSLLQNLLPVSFMAPTVLAVLPVPVQALNHSAVFAALLPLAVVKFVLWASVVSIVQTVYNGYSRARNVVSSFGMSALIETEWARLSVPEVLRTFWLLRVLEHTIIFFLLGSWSEPADAGPAYRLLKNVMVTGCDTLTAVLGITSIVSYLCHHIGKFFQWILLTEDENDKGLGTVSAILFYILALQTGLTGLEPEKRFVRLCRNFCLLFTALLHFIHNIVNPLLMSLSASHNPSLKRHVRALGVCAFLILFPILLLCYLWSHHTISTWLLAVTAFSIEVIVKVAVSLCIYSLFLLDARRETFWERLDDYVYYIRAFGNTVEFCFGILLFFNGAWILVFESGGRYVP